MKRQGENEVPTLTSKERFVRGEYKDVEEENEDEENIEQRK